jgi:predicted Zn-dependent protease
MNNIPWLHRFGWLAALAVLLVMSACASAPYTGRRQLLLTSEGHENTLGYQAFSQLKQQQKVSRDPKLNEMVTRVGQRIAAAANRPDYKWEFVVFEDDSPNAFCLPGGKVGIFTGILLRHAGERMSQSMVAQLGGLALGAAMAGQNPYAAQAAQQAYGLGATVGVLLPYSRKQELEADEVGLILMAKAGYDPEAAVGFWERMVAGSKGKPKPPPFLSTHPTDQRRIQEIQRMLPRIKERYYLPQ